MIGREGRARDDRKRGAGMGRYGGIEHEPRERRPSVRRRHGPREHLHRAERVVVVVVVEGPAHETDGAREKRLHGMFTVSTDDTARVQIENKSTEGRKYPKEPRDGPPEFSGIFKILRGYPKEPRDGPLEVSGIFKILRVKHKKKIKHLCDCTCYK